MTDHSFRESFRVTKEVFQYILMNLGSALAHKTERNQALSPQQQLMTFLHFLGTSTFYHVLKNAHGPSNATVCRVIERVAGAMMSLESELMGWPSNIAEVVSKCMVYITNYCWSNFHSENFEFILFSYFFRYGSSNR